MNLKALVSAMAFLSWTSAISVYAAGREVYPTQSTDGIYLDLEKGGFSFSTHSEEASLMHEWASSESSKDPAGAVKIIGIVTGKVGILNENGDGAICQGEEKTSPYSNPKLMEKGKFSINKIRTQAYQRAVDECRAEKGTLVMDGDGGVAIVHAHSQVTEPINGKSRSPSAAKSKKCFSSEVQVKCDLTAHAAEIIDLYRKFRGEYPAHPVANDVAFDALR